MTDDAVLRALLLRARNGDQWSFSSFVRHTQGSVQALMTYLGSAQTAEDLSQETFLRAYRSLPKYRGDASAGGWLMTIARRVAADSIRKETRQRQLRSLISRQEEIRSSASMESEPELQMLLSMLDADRREAFVLTQIIGLSYEEAADACDRAIGTIRSRVSRARATLAEAWSGASEPSIR